MDIHNDIGRETYIPWTSHNAQFFRRKQNQMRRKNRSARNADLLEDDPYLGQREEYSIKSDSFDVERMSTSIKIANGGLSYSNVDIEDYWKSKQSESRTSCNTIREREDNDCSSSLEQTLSSDATSCDNNSTIHIGKNKVGNNDHESKLQHLTDQEVLKCCKLEKNAAIKGLLTQKLISRKHFGIPVKEKTDHFRDGTTNPSSSKDLAEATTSSSNVASQMIPLPHDPDILMIPLLVEGTIDESKHPDLKFTIESFGKKTTHTPQHYYIHEIDDSMFTFVTRT